MEGEPIDLGLGRKLLNYADGLRQCAHELRRAREQSAKPKHLYVQARRTAVQAARIVVAAFDAGGAEFWRGTGEWMLSSLRYPDDPNRKPAEISVGGHRMQLRSIEIGSGCNPDGTLPDDTALALWQEWICPAIRAAGFPLKADVGAFDFPKVKTDEQGRVLGRDGKPLGIVETRDPETGAVSGWKKDGDAAQFTDDYDATDTLEHLRAQVADWSDCCDVASELLANEVRARTPDGSWPNSFGPERGTTWEQHVNDQFASRELCSPLGWEGEVAHDLPATFAEVGPFLQRELGGLLSLRGEDAPNEFWIEQGNALLRNTYRLLDQLQVKGAPPQPSELSDPHEIERTIRALAVWAGSRACSGKSTTPSVAESTGPLEVQLQKWVSDKQIAEMTVAVCRTVGLLHDLLRAIASNDQTLAASAYLSLYDPHDDGAFWVASRLCGPLANALRADSRGVTGFGLTAPNYHELALMLAGSIMVSIETGRSSVSVRDSDEITSRQIILVGRDPQGNVDLAIVMALIERNAHVLKKFADACSVSRPDMPWLEAELKMESARFIQRNTSGKESSSLSLLDQFPATEAGHLAFLEWVLVEVRDQAIALREGKYPHESIAHQLKVGVRWAEARTRVAFLTELQGNAVEQVVRVLRRDLALGTVEHIAELLEPAVRKLRDAWEDARDDTRPHKTESTDPRSIPPADNQTSTPAAPQRKKSGRPKADSETVRIEAELAADWERARESGTYKPVFAKDNGLTAAELNALLDRVAARNRRSDK